MGLVERINNDANTALKERNTVKLQTLKFVKEAVTNLIKSKHVGYEPSDVEIENIMQKMVKEREDVAVTYNNQGRSDLAEKELAEANIIKEYLPKQMSIYEVEEIINCEIARMGATSIKDMGNVMKSVKALIGNKSDGKTISTIVKKLLS